MEPVRVESQEIYFRASIGVAVFPRDGRDVETMIRHAGVAMYVAKRAKTGMALYDPKQDEHSRSRLSLINELRQGIEHDHLLLRWQPQEELATGRAGSAEALVRWQHPKHGLIMPDQFVKLAEQTGLIASTTEWVLKAALRQCRDWRRRDIHLKVAVNISALNLYVPGFVDTVGRALSESALPPNSLILELTESAVMEDPKRSLGTLVSLRDMGITISIDDYGTGYSSLAYLKRLPVGEIKIDKSFVREMASDEDYATIVKSTIELGHSLGLRVVAEGVEDKQTRDLLAGLGCDSAQGYLISPPISAEELDRWFEARPERTAGTVASARAPSRE